MQRDDLNIWPYGVLMTITASVLPYVGKVDETYTSCKFDNIYNIELPENISQSLLIGYDKLMRFSNKINIGQINLQLHACAVAVLLLIVYEVVKFKHRRVSFWSMLPIVGFAFHPLRIAIVKNCDGLQYTLSLLFSLLGIFAYLREIGQLNVDFSNNSSVGKVNADSQDNDTKQNHSLSIMYGIFKCISIIACFSLAMLLNPMAIVIPWLLFGFHFIFYKKLKSVVMIHYVCASIAVVVTTLCSIGCTYYLLLLQYPNIANETSDMLLALKNELLLAMEWKTLSLPATADFRADFEYDTDSAAVAIAMVIYKLNYCVYKLCVHMWLPNLFIMGLSDSVETNVETGVHKLLVNASLADADNMKTVGSELEKLLENIPTNSLIHVGLTMFVTVFVTICTLYVIFKQILNGITVGRNLTNLTEALTSGIHKVSLIATTFLVVVYWQLFIYNVLETHICAHGGSSGTNLEVGSDSYTECHLISWNSLDLNQYIAACDATNSMGVTSTFARWSYFPSSFAVICMSK